MEIISIISLVFAIVATVLSLIFLVPEKRRARLNGFGKFLHDLMNFKFLIVEKILQALYIFATAYIILCGFCMLFLVQETGGYYYSSTTWYGGYGLLTMILGPIGVRLAYEFLMMAILLIKNVIQINNKLKNQNDDGNDADIFAAPAIEFPKKPETYYCPNCGTMVTDAPFCPTCGTALK